MQIVKPAALAFLLLSGACASTPGNRGSRAAEQKPLRGGVAEFRVTSYNGRVLKGRVLLGATIDALVIDGRLYEWKDVELEKVRECGKTEELTYWAMEYLPPPPRADEVVTLSRGYWHGEEMVFPLFNPRTGLGPDCFDADLVMRVLDGRVAATLPIRVVRTDKPPATLDGGATAPKPAPSDAGAP